MKEKTKLRVIQILCIVSLLITVFSIQKTYAKYFEKVGTTYATNIKKWVINVNNFNIHEETTLNTVMTPVLRANTHMNNNNTLVPGREGYFEFDIDYTNVDVAFRFQFNITQLNTIPLEDFEIYGYSIVETDANTNEETETITNIDPVNDMTKLTQIIDPSKDVNNNDEKKRQLRILFRWNDGNADTESLDSVAGMNNSEDTAFVGEAIEGDTTAVNAGHTNLNYNVEISFTQQIL